MRIHIWRSLTYIFFCFHAYSLFLATFSNLFPSSEFSSTPNRWLAGEIESWIFAVCGAKLLGLGLGVISIICTLRFILVSIPHQITALLLMALINIDTYLNIRGSDVSTQLEMDPEGFWFMLQTHLMYDMDYHTSCRLLQFVSNGRRWMIYSEHRRVVLKSFKLCCYLKNLGSSLTRFFYLSTALLEFWMGPW